MKAGQRLPEAKGFPVRPMVEIDLSKVNIDTKSNSGISKDDAFTLEAK